MAKVSDSAQNGPERQRVVAPDGCESRGTLGDTALSRFASRPLDSLGKIRLSSEELGVDRRNLLHGKDSRNQPERWPVMPPATSSDKRSTRPAWSKHSVPEPRLRRRNGGGMRTSYPSRQNHCVAFSKRRNGGSRRRWSAQPWPCSKAPRSRTLPKRWVSCSSRPGLRLSP